MYSTYAAGILIPTGSLNDVEHKEGLHHLMEHMLFESKFGYESRKKIDKVGGVYNAVTSHNFIAIYGQSLLDNKEDLNKFLKDLVTNFEVTEDILKKEKSIVSKEIMMYANQPIEFLNDLLIYNQYGKTYNILGTTKSIKNINLVDLSTKFKQIKDNYIFVDSISEITSIVPSNCDVKKDTRIKMDELKVVKYSLESHLSYIGISISIPSRLINYSDFILEILYNKIFKNLREKNGLIYRALKRKTYTHNNVVYNFFYQSDIKDVNTIIRQIRTVFNLFKIKDLQESSVLNYIHLERVKETLLTDNPIGNIKKKMYESLSQNPKNTLRELLEYFRDIDYSTIVLISDKNKGINIKRYR